MRLSRDPGRPASYLQRTCSDARGFGIVATDQDNERVSETGVTLGFGTFLYPTGHQKPDLLDRALPQLGFAALLFHLGCATLFWNECCKVRGVLGVHKQYHSLPRLNRGICNRTTRILRPFGWSTPASFSTEVLEAWPRA